MSVNLEYLSHFILAAECRSFTLAATRLFISQSTLSRQIKNLEDELGVPLFIRNGRTVDLTKAGETLYNVGRPLLSHLDRVTELVSQTGAYMEARIQLYTVPAFFDEITEAYRRLSERGFRLELCLHHMEQTDAFALLESESVDFIVTYEQFIENSPKFRAIPFAEESFVIACAPGHPLAGKKSVSFEEALQENVLFGRDFPTRVKNGAPMSETVLPEGTLRLTLQSFHPQICLGEGIVIIPRHCGYAFDSRLCYIPISDPKLRQSVVLMSKTNRSYSLEALAFARALEEIGRENNVRLPSGPQKTE